MASTDECVPFWQPAFELLLYVFKIVILFTKQMFLFLLFRCHLDDYVEN